MKTNTWNIKEILNIPYGSGGSKVSSKSGTSSDYSSLTDSQFLLGSQFWPENSQALSQDVSFSSRNTKQNSEEGSELRVSANYHAKPYLFGGDTETHSTTNSKPTIGVLDRFEEDKKRAKDKSESETIHHEFLKLHDSLEKVIRLLENVNDSGEATHKGLVEGINGLTRTIKESMASVWDGITPKIEAVIMKLNSQSQTLKEMEDREAKLVTATKDLSTHLQDLQRNMDSLKVEHGQEQTVLVELQSLLTATAEARSQRSASRPVQMVSSEVQTSPGLVEQFCVVSEEKRVFEGVRLCGPSATRLHAKPSEPTLPLSSSTKQTNTDYDQTVPTKATLCPLPTNQQERVMHMASDGLNESLWQQSFCRQALKAAGDADIVSGSALQEPRRQYALRQRVMQSSCFLGSMQEDSQMVAIADKPQNRVMPAREEVMAPNFSTCGGPQKTWSKKRPRGKRRALIPQNVPSVYRGAGQGNGFHKSRPNHKEEEEEDDDELYPMYETKNKALRENIKPAFTLKENKQVSVHNDNGNGRQHVWNMWSQNTDSVQHWSACDGVDRRPKGKAKVKAKAGIPQKANESLWNLFDFDDSD
ncbi:interactor of HORMAD1 protein 1 [Alosa alosa]|nr:interactor of HORMAD1 protein 1 [Alosa alosa]XP_048110244.1 interactor of HORMAD1 protein 1 [Alosa alosa]